MQPGRPRGGDALLVVNKSLMFLYHSGLHSMPISIVGVAGPMYNSSRFDALNQYRIVQSFSYGL